MTQLKKAKSSSFSRASDFEKCPLFFKYRHIEKIPDPRPVDTSLENPLDRGTRLHALAENYVQNPKLPLAIELEPFRERFDKLRVLYQHGLVTLEEPVAFDITWNRCSPTDFDNAIYRMVADVVIRPKPESIVIIDHKGLDVDTKLPTPTGFTTMGDIQAGDTLFDVDGNECKVIDKSQVKHLKCYRVKFNDGTEVVCDEEHLWSDVDGNVIGVLDLMGNITPRQRYNVPKIPVCGALDCSKKELPIHPYVLGLWIADGKHSSAEITKPDTFIWDKIQSLGYKVNTNTKQTKRSCPTFTVQSIRRHLNNLGMLNERNKFIPEEYLLGSFEQRLHLLQGLMDGDGSSNHTRKQCVYCTVNESLAKQVQRLLNSMGQQSYISPFEAKGFGKTTTAYYVMFRPSNFQPFSLPRKASKTDLAKWGAGKSKYRIAKSVELVPTRPTQCIAVDSPTRTFLCTEQMVPTHNTGKKSGNEVKHHDQCMEYATSFALIEQEVQEFTLQLWYLDQPQEVGNPTIKVFTREQVLQNFPRMKARHTKVISTTLFPAHPSQFACRFCPYKAGTVGAGKRAYPGTGHCRRNIC